MSEGAGSTPSSATAASDPPRELPRTDSPSPEQPTTAASPSAIDPAPGQRDNRASGELESETQPEPEPEPEPESESESESDGASEAESDLAALLELDGGHSTSLGGPGYGTLQGGVALPVRGPGFVHNARRPREARYGTVELVQAIARAAATVEREMPGSGLVVNDLCLREGGPIPQHGSHQNGRDADILFYALDSEGQPMPAVGVPLDREGKGWDFKDLSVPDDDVEVWIDLPRTWRFMQALIEEAGEDVQRIFIVEHVRSMLLEQAAQAEAPRKVVERFAMVACQPGTPHDDHMHVRLYCTPEDIEAGCLDKPPIYPWHRKALRALGLAPVIERVPLAEKRRRNSAVASRTTTRAQARARAGPMHRDVRRFLDRRESWATASPGRRWCR